MTKTALHVIASETDTKLAEIYTAKAYAQAIVTQSDRSLARSADYLASQLKKIEDRRAAAVDDIAKLTEEAKPLEAIYADEGGWSRFFLVTNTNGHIHADTSCSTCYATTLFSWLPELSGLTEADAVESYGEILCSVCFPSAPAEWTNGESKATKEAKAERAAAKAERHAKKVAKALDPERPDEGVQIEVGTRPNGEPRYERVKTIAAAKAWLTDAAEWRASYARQGKPGSHPAYPVESERLLAELLAERTGETVEAVTAAAEKRAAKRLS